MVPDRVPHALAHGAVVFVHGVLESQSPALRAQVVLEGAPVREVDQVLDASRTLALDQSFQNILTTQVERIFNFPKP